MHQVYFLGRGRVCDVAFVANKVVDDDQWGDMPWNVSNKIFGVCLLRFVRTFCNWSGLASRWKVNEEALVNSVLNVMEKPSDASKSLASFLGLIFTLFVD